MGTPQYVVVPCDYESLIHQGYQAQLQAQQEAFQQQLSCLQEQHIEEIARLELATTRAKEESSNREFQILAWRKKACTYKMRIASKDEDIRTIQENCQALEQGVVALTAEREQQLQCIAMLQDQLQAATALCQGEHRQMVVHQGRLATTDAELRQLQQKVADSHAKSEDLLKQLTESQAALAAATAENLDIGQQLDVTTSTLNASQQAHAGLQAQHEVLQAQQQQTHEQMQAAYSRIDRLDKELKLSREQLQSEQAKWHSFLQNSQLAQEQCEQLARHAKDVVVKAQLESIAKLTSALDDERAQAEQRLKRVHETLQQEQAVHAAAEKEVAALRKQCLDLEASHLTAQRQLHKQLADKDVAAAALQGRVTVLEAQVAARDQQISSLQEALDHSVQQLGDKMSKSDKMVEALRSQLQAMRQQVAQKDIDVHELQSLHGSKLQQLQQQLAKAEADLQQAAAQHEAVEERMKVETQKGQYAITAEAEMRRQVAALQEALLQRDAAMSQLQEHMQHSAQEEHKKEHEQQRASAAEANLRPQVSALQEALRQRDEAISKLLDQARRVPDVDFGSHDGQAQQQVQTALGAVDKLMGSLVYQPPAAVQPGAPAADETEDSDADPMAEMIITMSQRRKSGAPDNSKPAPATEAPPAQAPAQPPGAKAPRRNKRAAEEVADAPAASRPGRGRKATKASVEQPATDVVDAPTAQQDDKEPVQPSQQQPPAVRQAPRRRAAQNGQAKAAAMAEALAGSDDEASRGIDTPGFELKSSKQQARKGQGQVQQPERPLQKPQELAAIAEQQQAAAAPAAQGTGGQGGSGQQPRGKQGKPALQREADAANMLKDIVAAAPPTANLVQDRMGNAEGDDINMVPATQVPPDEEQQDTSQPQQHLPAQHLLASQPVLPAAASQLGPTGSRASIFSQSLFGGFRSQMLDKPLAALNASVLQSAQVRRQLVPLTSINAMKPQARTNQLPGSVRGISASQPSAAKRALPQPSMGLLGTAAGRAMPGDKLPNELLLKSLMQQPKMRKANE